MLAVICEDDSIYIKGLTYSCEAWAARHPEAGLITRQYSSPEDLLYDWENGMRFDILFLDIMFDQMNGVSLAKIIRESDSVSMIVFVTNSRQYAVGGYELNIHRYLLKPVSDQSISDCLDYCYKHHFISREYISFQSAGGVLRFPANELIKIETNLHTLELTFPEGRKEIIRIYEPLDQIMKRLPAQWFLRVSRNAIINLLYLRRFDHKEIELIGDPSPVTIGTVYRKTVYHRLSDHFWSE